MESKIEILAFHGWGFDGTFWDSWKEVLPDEVLLKPADKGYFGGEFNPEFSENAKAKVLFLHSYGVHWCPIELFIQADSIVVFNGFNSFHPLERREKSKSKKVLSLMVKQFKANPKRVLQAFRSNCFYPETSASQDFNWMNTTKLKTDLASLHKTRLKLPKEFSSNWVILDSSEDKIVPGSRAKELDTLGTVNHQNFEGCGHALPVVNILDCWSYLCAVIPIFKEYGDHTK
ncbi:MAG: hypothetical protein RLN81_01130 [Balneolaceae bacterium]